MQLSGLKLQAAAQAKNTSLNCFRGMPKASAVLMRQDGSLQLAGVCDQASSIPLV